MDALAALFQVGEKFDERSGLKRAARATAGKDECECTHECTGCAKGEKNATGVKIRKGRDSSKDFGQRCGGDSMARRASRNTLSSIGRVNRPVNVFCWLG
jgi:hypothetical protein